MQSIDKARATGLARFTSLVYLYTGLGVAFWTLAANAIARNTSLSYTIMNMMSGHALIFSLVIIAVAFAFINMANRFATRSYAMTFVSYVLFLLTMSVFGVPVFYIYTAQSIVQSLAVTSVIFVVAAGIGFFTKKDLTSWNRTLLIGLISIIVVSFINLVIFHSTVAALLVNIAVIIVFLFYIAFDSQNIKRIYANAQDSENLGAIALVASISLVMDFINIFLSILSIFGNSN
ncbi:Bax inhibitor-1/YccA family protein [Companilactobacillus jidongensis]|uniref:Bax inhibitor-1/YccA family protein n=1 Tax=Companilactobacillus jidongensis TaxID=2486006 RepID=UPI000F7773AA|nr:Bax inhibitor-1 family protein [Companilactobacillus jidongensis]